jgi:hypothetical protein
VSLEKERGTPVFVELDAWSCSLTVGLRSCLAVADGRLELDGVGHSLQAEILPILPRGDAREIRRAGARTGPAE